METRANYALVGLFTLSVIAAGFGFVYWFAQSVSNGAKAEYRIVFNGSVSGLSRGSLVRFNGLRVGEVASIDLVPDDPAKVAAVVELDPKTPIKTDTRARLEVQALSGAASIQLTGGSNTAAALATPDGTGRPTIFADRSDFQDLLETVQRLSGRADGVLAQVDKLLADNQQPINNAIRSVEVFAKALADNSAGVSSFLATIGDTGQRISSLAVRLEALAGTADTILQSVETDRVRRIVANVEAITQNFSDNGPNIDSILTEGATLTRRLAETSIKLDETLTDIDRAVKAFDATSINRSLANVEKVTTALARNELEIDSTLKNVAQIAETLRGSSEKLDRVLVAAETFLGTNQGAAQSVFADIGEAARAFRTLSENLDKRTAELSTGINRLTGSGVRDLQAVAGDTRRALNELSNTVRSINRDPTQFIRGARPPIPEYTGSR